MLHHLVKLSLSMKKSFCSFAGCGNGILFCRMFFLTIIRMTPIHSIQPAQTGKVEKHRRGSRLERSCFGRKHQEQGATDETTTGEASSDEETSSEGRRKATQQMTLPPLKNKLLGRYHHWCWAHMNTVTIETEDGTTLSFSIPDDAGPDRKLTVADSCDTLKLLIPAARGVKTPLLQLLKTGIGDHCKTKQRSNSRNIVFIFSYILCRQRGTGGALLSA